MQVFPLLGHIHVRGHSEWRILTAGYQTNHTSPRINTSWYVHWEQLKWFQQPWDWRAVRVLKESCTLLHVTHVCFPLCCTFTRKNEGRSKQVAMRTMVLYCFLDLLCSFLRFLLKPFFWACALFLLGSYVSAAWCFSWDYLGTWDSSGSWWAMFGTLLDSLCSLGRWNHSWPLLRSDFSPGHHHHQKANLIYYVSYQALRSGGLMRECIRQYSGLIVITYLFEVQLAKKSNCNGGLMSPDPDHQTSLLKP